MFENSDGTIIRFLEATRRILYFQAISFEVVNGSDFLSFKFFYGTQF